MGRREMREHIFKLLFMNDFNQTEEMPEQLEMYFAGLDELKDKDEKYMAEKFEHVKEQMKSIDEMISSSSKGWKVSRMSKVDLNILRLAVYEMKFDEDVPVKVAINEAVEIAKSFGGDASASFVNGVLGDIAKEQG